METLRIVREAQTWLQQEEAFSKKIQPNRSSVLHSFEQKIHIFTFFWNIPVLVKVKIWKSLISWMLGECV